MRIFFLKCREPVGREILEGYKDLQVLNSRYVAGREHIEFAVAQADEAFRKGKNISRDPHVEVLVRASGQRQIKKALELFGLSSREIVVIGEKLPEELRECGCVESSGEVDEEKYEGIKDAFGISEAEILAAGSEDFSEKVRSLKEIIKERVALTDIA